MKPFIDWPEVMGIPDVIDCAGLERDDVYEMFGRKDFPLLIPDKRRSRRVGKYALRQWLNCGATITD